MENKKLEEISKTDLKELPNSKLVEIMDLLSSDFESTKANIINLTYYLDNIEIIYNKTLEEYQNRTK